MRQRGTDAARMPVQVWLLAITVLVSPWNGIHVPGVSHLFFAGLALTAGAALIGRPGSDRATAPRWLIGIGVALACLALINTALPPSPLIAIRTQQATFVTGLFSAPSGAIQPGSNLGNLVRLECAMVLMPILISMICTTRRKVRFVTVAWIVGASVSAAIALIDALTHIGIGGALTGNTLAIAASGRQVGLTDQPNHLGVSCLLVLPVAVTFLISASRRTRIAARLVIALLLGGIIESGSRGAIAVAPVVALLPLVAIPSLRRYIAPVAGLVVAAIAVLILIKGGVHLGGTFARFDSGQSSAQSSNAGRLLFLGQALSQAAARPFTGFGFSQLQSGHVLYAELAASGGVALLMLFIGMSTKYIFAGIEAFADSRDPLVAALTVSFVAWLAVGFVENQVADGYLYVAPGLLLAVSALLRTRSHEPPVPLSSGLRRRGPHPRVKPHRPDAADGPMRRQTPALSRLPMRRDGRVRTGEQSWLKGWAADTGVMVMSQVMLTATAVLVTVLLSHGLSRYDFGIFVSLLAFSQALSFVVDVGLPSYLMRETTADYSARTRGELSQTELMQRVSERLWDSLYIVASTGFGVAVIVTCGAVLLGLSWRMAAAEGVLLLYVAILAASIALESDLRSRRKRGQVVTALSLERVTILLGVAVVLILHFGVLGIAVSSVVGGSLRFCYSFSKSIRQMHLPRPSISRRSFRIVRGSAPFAANTAALNFFPRVDAALVALVSVIAASFFALGFQIATTAFLLANIASSTIYPFLSKHDNHGRSTAVVGIMGIAGLIIGAVGVAIAPRVVPLLFGQKYEASVATVQIMLVSVPFVFVISALMPVLYTANRERSVVRAIWPLSVLGTGFVLAGALAWGSAGAGAGYAMRYALQACVVGGLAYRARHRGALHSVGAAAERAPA